jgi:cytochrome c5
MGETMNRITYMLVAVAALTPSALNAGNCGQLFHHRQAIVHHVAPQVFYFAGQNTQNEAEIRKAIRAELPAIIQQLQSGREPVTAAATGVFAAKCAKCHKGETALTSDPATFKAFARMAGLGEGIPNEMKAVIGGLTGAEKGELTEYLLRLPAARIEPQVTIPPPEESGVLR